ncbi:glycosyltransferase family 62 protein [Mucor lusitanicus CBS 277.49]|uniref:Glycosyltransferase family 62 protein n=1 Tax=Mucor lusitanicus CBS 277.49 TaxID=747725 RepID=A0A168MXX0_MUCCL|nr:glycosyltransferase family 62 protein [Mucor lusitanicus CBS 277.49]
MRHHNYMDLNNLNSTRFGKEANEHVLVLTPLQNDERYLDHYFQLLDKTNYPNHLISIGLLVSDSTDDTLEKLYDTVHRLQNRWRNRFYEIDVYQKDFRLDEKPNDTSLNSRRATLARAKNFLLTAALREHHSWIAWVDVKLHSYPATIFSDLMLVDGDVVVPNCLLKRQDDEFWGFDRNNWQESDLSLEKQQNAAEHEVLMEGKRCCIIFRLVDMPTHQGTRIPLDGVGTTFTLVKATVHREGAIFPPFVYQHELDSEGFAKMVKSMGFSVYGIPSYTIYHF